MNLLLALTPILAEIDADQIIKLMIQIVVVGLIAWMCWWLIGYAGVPEPFSKVLRVIIALFAVVFLAYRLLSLT